MTDPTAAVRAAWLTDDVIRAVCETETRYIQGFTYSETHVIRDVARPAAEDTLWRGPACTPKNDAAFQAQCDIERMRRRLQALVPHVEALISAAREAGAREENEAAARMFDTAAAQARKDFDDWAKKDAEAARRYGAAYQSLASAAHMVRQRKANAMGPDPATHIAALEAENARLKADAVALVRAARAAVPQLQCSEYPHDRAIAEELSATLSPFKDTPQ